TLLTYIFCFLFILLQRTPRSTLFPYTTLFRSVFAGEPNIHPAYRELPNVFGLPHIGSSTERTRLAMGQLLCEGIEAFFTGEKPRSEEHTSELQSRENLVCRLLLEKKNRSAKRE